MVNVDNLRSLLSPIQRRAVRGDCGEAAALCLTIVVLNVTGDNMARCVRRAEIDLAEGARSGTKAGR